MILMLIIPRLMKGMDPEEQKVSVLHYLYYSAVIEENSYTVEPVTMMGTPWNSHFVLCREVVVLSLEVKSYL